MKKKNILFVFLFLIGLLSGCGNNVEGSSTDLVEGGDFIYTSYYTRNSGLAYVNVISVSDDCYIDGRYYGLTEQFPELNYYRTIMVKCEVVEDFYGRFEAGAIINIPIRNYLENKDYLESIKNWINDLDQLVIACQQESDSYYESIGTYINEKTEEKYDSYNLMKRVSFAQKDILGIKDNKLDLKTFDEITEGYFVEKRKNYFEFMFNHIYDGMSNAELVNFLRNHIKK